MIPRFASAAAKLMATLGETGSYTVTATATAIPLRMLIDRDITTPLPGMQGTVLDRRTVLTATAADLHAAGITPVKGDTFTLGAEVWTVLGIEQQDSVMTWLKVRK